MTEWRRENGDGDFGMVAMGMNGEKQRGRRGVWGWKWAIKFVDCTNEH